MSHILHFDTISYEDSIRHESLTTKLDGKTIGDKIVIVCPPRFNPKCWYCTSTNKRCKQHTMYKYVMSDNKIYDVCSKIQHRSKIIERGDNNEVALYLLRQVYKSDEESDVKIHFRIIGINVSKENDISCPMISNVKDPIQMKKDLIEKSDETYAVEAVQRDIIDTLHHKLYLYRYSLQKSEESLSAHKQALRYMQANVDFVPSNRKLFESNKTICTLCNTVLNEKDSCTMYECEHSFHNECLRNLFDKKIDLKCPICNVVCDHDKYFVYNRYVSTSI